jgi:hypothetical protein
MFSQRLTSTTLKKDQPGNVWYMNLTLRAGDRELGGEAVVVTVQRVKRSGLTAAIFYLKDRTFYVSIF